ncbi:receptor L domain protein, partial [Opisthorchis viverrini]
CRTETTWMNMAQSWSILSGQLEYNCSLIFGNLVIAGLTDEDDLSILESIEEISGYLVIHGVGRGHLRLPNLQIIRGQDYVSIRERRVAMLISSNYNTKSILDTPQSTEYAVGALRRNVSKNQPNYPGSASSQLMLRRKRSIFNGQVSQLDPISTHTKDSPMRTAEEPRAVSDYPVQNGFRERLTGPTHILSNELSANEISKSSTTDFTSTRLGEIFTSTSEARTDEQATLATNGDPSESDLKPQCKDASATELFSDYAGSEKPFLRDGDICVPKCSRPGTYARDGHCVPCPNNICPKVCSLKEIEKIKGVDYLHKSTLRAMQNCTTFEGDIKLSRQSFI